MNNYMKGYRLKNLETLREYRNNYMRERYKNNKEQREKIKTYYRNKYQSEQRLLNMFEGLIKSHGIEENKGLAEPIVFSNKVTF